MTYSNANDLYNALIATTAQGKIATYMRTTGNTGEALTSEDGMNFVHTKMTMCQVNGKQRKIPSYLTQSGNDLKMSVWGKFECDNHTNYLDTTKQPYRDLPMMAECDFFIILLNNNNKVASKTINCVIDVDSEDELWNLYKNGFPVFDTPFTLSATKRLPHFYIQTTHTKQVLGERLGRDFDLIVNYIFERKTNEVFGVEQIPTMSHEDLSIYLNIPIDTFQPLLAYPSRKAQEIRKANKVPAQCNFDDEKRKFVVDVGSKRFQPNGEVIPYMTLVRIFDALPVDKYSGRSQWLCIVRATINMITPNSNANDYLTLLNNFYKKAINYQDFYPEENAEVFAKFMNDGSYTSLGAEWLYKQLATHCQELHTELAFDKTRDMDTRNFGKLTAKNAVKVFNDRCAFIDGNVCQFVEFNATSNQFIFRQEKDLNLAYRNLYCMAKVTKFMPDCTPMEKTTKTKFIKHWLDSEDRKTHRGGVCFAPPPKVAPHNQFNLFTGFDIDRITDYDDVIDKMTQAELEDKLSFILQHLTYLSGEDKTSECYDFNLKYFAHLLKYPAILPRVALVWTSVAGVGKNQWLNFIELIMGKQYYYSSANSKELLGDFNDAIRGKLLLNLNEFKKSTDFMEAIKELVTETTISTREKHKNPIRVENCSRTVITTNSRPQILEFKARRFQVNRCSPYPASDEMRYEKLYGKQLHENITDIFIQKCFLYYCRNYVQITKSYNFETNRVITDEYLMLRSRNIPIVLRFLRHWYASFPADDTSAFTSREMYDIYKQWCNVEGEARSYSQSEFINHIEVHTKRQNTSSYLSSNPDAVIDMPKGKKQKVFRLDRVRCKAFLDSENIDTSLFIPSSDDEDDEDDE